MHLFSGLGIKHYFKYNYTENCCNSLPIKTVSAKPKWYSFLLVNNIFETITVAVRYVVECSIPHYWLSKNAGVCTPPWAMAIFHCRPLLTKLIFHPMHFIKDIPPLHYCLLSRDTLWSLLRQLKPSVYTSLKTHNPIMQCSVPHWRISSNAVHRVICRRTWK